MNIWIDILTPKQLLFFEPMIEKLSRRHKILCTTRDYREVNHLIKIGRSKALVLGKHGGVERSEKLKANITRMRRLVPIIEEFKPDVTVSFCSPDAARISYGLQIKHVAFSDAPHGTAIMKLTIPLIQKLLTPWVIPKKEFTKHGIPAKNIIRYRAIDAAFIIKQRSRVDKKTVPVISKQGKKNILFRTHESHASYPKKDMNIAKIINRLAKIPDTNVMVLGRYSNEIKQLRKSLDSDVIVLQKSVDSKEVLAMTDIFVGSGGTMTAESALRGIPTISYNAVPNIIEEYLVKKKLVVRADNINELDGLILELMVKNLDTIQRRARDELNKMESPLEKLEHVLTTLDS